MLLVDPARWNASASTVMVQWSTHSRMPFVMGLLMCCSSCWISSRGLQHWCRAHLVRYHGVFSPEAKHRRHIIATVSPTAPCADDTLVAKEVKAGAAMSWMRRLRGVFAIDISTCPRCGGKVRVIAAITELALITRILGHRVSPGSMKTKSSCEKAAGARAPSRASLH
jgi:hypothetical protein